MPTRFDSFHRPPPPGEFVLTEVWPAIQREARHQLDAFYPVLDAASEQRTLSTLEHGIFSMLKRGAARVEWGMVEFWNPVEGRYQPYDTDYNELMLDFMRDFGSRYRRTRPGAAAMS